VLVIVCYVLMYSGGCSVVMAWWVVGEGNVVNVNLYMAHKVRCMYTNTLKTTEF